jgi:hypothetical protein
MPDEEINQSLVQKKIAFANNSESVEAVLAILREVMGTPKLVGDTEFETLRNAITLDAQSELVVQFINKIDHIKSGGLVSTQL